MKAIPTTSPCTVAAIDHPGPGGAHHHYGVQGLGREVQFIRFQCGPRGEPGSVEGLMDDDLLAIVEDRLQAFQVGDFACAENGVALDHLQIARQALGLRVARRIAQGVLGLNVAHQAPPAAPARSGCQDTALRPGAEPPPASTTSVTVAVAPELDAPEELEELEELEEEPRWYCAGGCQTYLVKRPPEEGCIWHCVDCAPAVELEPPPASTTSVTVAAVLELPPAAVLEAPEVPELKWTWWCQGCTKVEERADPKPDDLDWYCPNCATPEPSEPAKPVEDFEWVCACGGTDRKPRPQLDGSPWRCKACRPPPRRPAVDVVLEELSLAPAAMGFLKARLVAEGYSEDSARTCVVGLCNRGKVVRLSKGVYALPATVQL